MITPAEAAVILVLTSGQPEQVKEDGPTGANTSIGGSVGYDEPSETQPLMREYTGPGCGSNRVHCTGIDVGYGGAAGQNTYNFPSGYVTSHFITMGSGGGRIAFVPGGFVDNEVTLHMWVSSEADGDAINEGCYWVTYTENFVEFRTGAGGCWFPPMETNYLNFAFCRSPSASPDPYCRAEGATASRQQQTLFMRASWY